jgi:ADP-ribose pyrophosphatase YjhB (NUDIX family)
MSDPAAGTWEFAGGHVEGDESPRQAALREWQEETGLPFPDGEWTGTWTSASGIYQGFVLTIPREADLDILARRIGSDPDGDVTDAETIAWWDPADLPGNPAIRPELLADIDAVMTALGCTEGAAGCCGGDCCQGGCCGGTSGCGCGPAAVEGAVAKAADARPKAFRPPTLDIPNLTGVWAEVYDRREKLLRKHLKAVAAAWDACLAELGSSRPVVREFRAKAGQVAKLAGPDAKWWKDAGTAAALAWLLRLSKTKGYPALVAALEDAIRSGMAQGEADALALAADRQGAAGFRIDQAFRAAYERLAGDAKVAQQAQDAAAGIVDGAAGDAGRALADQAEGDGSEQDMAGAVDGALSGDRSQSVGVGTDWWLWLGIGTGALALYQRIGTDGAGGNAADVATLVWVDAGDSRVCQTCQDNSDNSPYTLSSAPTLPGHPRCRCSWDTTATVASSWLDAFLLD